MIEQAATLRERMRHALIAAVPVPFSERGEIDLAAQEAYVSWMTTQPVEGVAVWVHTGRGLMLSAMEREAVIRSWRNALPSKLIIAGAGGDPNATSDAAFIQSATSMATNARELGADAVLAFAPTRFRDREAFERDRMIVEYHAAIASVGLPMLGFYLYEAAGGIAYSTNVIATLFSIPEVFGMKMATLDSVMTFQRVAQFMRLEFSDHLLVTGEDRFLGYSLMMGAEAALIGMASARTTLQHEMMQAFFMHDLDRFAKLSAKVDQLAQATFVPPMEGYITRMLHVLANDGVIPQSSANDPWGPALWPREIETLRTFLATFDASY